MDKKFTLLLEICMQVEISVLIKAIPKTQTFNEILSNSYIFHSYIQLFIQIHDILPMKLSSKIKGNRRD